MGEIRRRALLGLMLAAGGAFAVDRTKRSAASGKIGAGERAGARALPRLSIGMNLAGIADWDPGFPFRNLMWGARPWLTRNANDCCGPWNTEKIGAFELDENGYPLESPLRITGVPAQQEPFTLLPTVRKPGKYVLLHDGEGEFTGLLGTKVLAAEPGRVLLQMTQNPKAVEGFAIRRSRRGDHVRNIRVLPLEDEKADLSGNPFLPEFLDFCQPFHVLRFMDWAATNGSLEEEWSKRKKPSFYTMVGSAGDPEGVWEPPPTDFIRRFSGGVAIEVILQVANRLGVDPWLCIPHRASDEYISEYAKLARSQLDPSRRLYVEYSNELWNWGFNQAQWMLRSPLAGGLVEAKGGRAWEDKAKAKGNGHPERIGALFRRAFGHWEREWNGKDRGRLVRVCAVQHAWIDAARRTAKWCAENGGADVLSPAGYFGPSEGEYRRWAARGAELTADEVIADMKLVLERDTAKWTREQAAIAKEFGLGYAVYEGGQHLQPKDQADLPYNPALGAAQKHSGMYDLYLRDLEIHQAAECRVFCAFSSISGQGTRWGSWGAKSAYDEPLSEAPKMRALLDCNLPRSGQAG